MILKFKVLNERFLIHNKSNPNKESEVEKVKWYSLSEIKNMVDLQSPILVPPLYGTTYEKIWPYLKSRFDIDIDKSE